jgi:hypothetical protein
MIGPIKLPRSAVSQHLGLSMISASNNILKALYAAFFAGGRATAGSAAVLVLLAIAGVVLAMVIGGL